MSEKTRPGPTYQFPQGRIHETDDGELVIRIGVSRRKVVLEFGVPTKWIGFGPTEARALGEALIEKANLAERQADS